MFLRSTLRGVRGVQLLSRPSPSPSPSRRLLGDDVHVVSSPFPDVDIPDTNVAEFVWRRMDEWPDKIAVECGVSGRRLTYSELRLSCRRFACALRRAGCAPGHVLAVALPNTPDFPLAALAAVEAQLLLTTVNPAYTPGEIGKQLADCGARVVVTLPERYEDVLTATRLSGLQPPPMIILAESSERVAPGNLPAGVPRLRDMIAADVDEPLDALYRVERDTPVVVPYSSGTTGLPKGVLLSHRNLIANVVQMQAPGIALTDYATGNQQDVVPSVLPFFHIYGLTVTLLSKLHLGNRVVSLPGFSPASFLGALTTHRPRTLYLVPPLVLFLGTSPAVTADHLASVDVVMSGAAPLGEQDMLRFRDKAPHAHCLQGYGMTEMSPVGTSSTRGSTKYASVGACLPNTRAKIVHTETGLALPAGEVGEVCVRGPQNMLGYYHNAAATAETVDAAGWLHTGDLGRYDADGEFYIVDRLKELIKVKGLQVAPAELEELLRAHPDVADAAVVGVADARAGERPLAFVVPRAGANVDGLADRVREFVASQLSEHKHLKGGVRIVDAIPKSASGKILRNILRAQLKAERG